MSKQPPKTDKEYFDRLAELLSMRAFEELFDMAHTLIESNYPRAKGDESARNLRLAGDFVMFVDAWLPYLQRDTLKHKEANRGTENRKTH